MVPYRTHWRPAVSRHSGINRPVPGTGCASFLHFRCHHSNCVGHVCSIKVHFKDSKGNLLKTVEANEGDDILAIAHEYDIDLEGVCVISYRSQNQIVTHFPYVIPIQQPTPYLCIDMAKPCPFISTPQELAKDR